MTDRRDTAEWRREELPHPVPAFRLRWLALAGAAATIVAAATLVLGIGDTLSGSDRSAGRLLPLQAASPPASAAPEPSSPPEPSAPEPSSEPPRAETSEPLTTSIHDALLRLRYSVDEGVAAGDVRDDVGLDLGNVIERMLGQGRRPLERRREDVAYLQQKIATRTREGAITDGRAEELRGILARARPR
ncbi:hypothetical protein [Actinomadura darangshiensis]|uniref:hypothetical protein n=1 Tax=Actinomadura darangshiensis TaxID=705336 RepID=UPI00140D25EF|nr:hypothetical protein [Actinomadura darangshiensis]